MKSSPNTIYGARGGVLPRNWVPNDFAKADDAPHQDDAKRVEYLLSLFQPASRPATSPSESKQARAAAAVLAKSSPSLMAGLKSAVQTWAPGELTPLVDDVEVFNNSPIFVKEESFVAEDSPFAPVPTTEELSAEKKEIEVLRAEAERFIEEAKNQAAVIIAEAHTKAEEVLMKAHQDGWAAADAEAAPIIETAKSIVEQVSAWREEILTQSESMVLDLVKNIAKRMFGQGYVLESEPLQQAFNHVLESARSLGDLKIFVNPDDASQLGPYWREFQVSITGRQVQIIPTESISRGGCFVDGEFGSVDGRLETQFKAIMESLNENAQSEEQTA